MLTRAAARGANDKVLAVTGSLLEGVYPATARDKQVDERDVTRTTGTRIDATGGGVLGVDNNRAAKAIDYFCFELT